MKFLPHATRVISLFYRVGAATTYLITLTPFPLHPQQRNFAVPPQSRFLQILPD